MIGVLLISMATAGVAESTLRPRDLAVVVNTDDPGSVEVAGDYLRLRRIPERNLLRVSIPGSPSRLTLAQFEDLKLQLEPQLRPDLEAMVLVWTTPYAVACNSITSALTLGFDAAQCEAGCAPGRPSPYFDARTRRPFRELGVRPSMLLPATNVELAKAVIDRGRSAGFRIPEAGAYFMVTRDKARNSRAIHFPPSGRIPARRISVHTLEGPALADVHDIMIYQIGAVAVERLETLTFLPGALADHLTSSGGQLVDSTQMSGLRWLEAGATASYGTVSEPCNHPQKFPNGTVLLKHYLAGDTALEAYWKSVAWPAQGVFIGEPLAAPYCASCGLGDPAP